MVGGSFTLQTQFAFGNDGDHPSYVVLKNRQTINICNWPATYTYLANSPLMGQIVFANSGAVRMTTTKQYDYLNRLTGISSSSSLSSSFNYQYNQKGVGS